MGTIGKVAAEFKSFMAYYSQLPDIKKILADPKNADMPTQIGQVYALTGVVSQAMTDNIGTPKVAALVEYMERMEPEMQTVCMVSTLRRTRKLISDPSVNKWINNNTARITAAL